MNIWIYVTHKNRVNEKNFAKLDFNPIFVNPSVGRIGFYVGIYLFPTYSFDHFTTQQQQRAKHK